MAVSFTHTIKALEPFFSGEGWRWAPVSFWWVLHRASLLGWWFRSPASLRGGALALLAPLPPPRRLAVSGEIPVPHACMGLTGLRVGVAVVTRVSFGARARAPCWPKLPTAPPAAP